MDRLTEDQGPTGVDFEFFLNEMKMNFTLFYRPTKKSILEVGYCS